jgi:hypothetical protein
MKREKGVHMKIKSCKEEFFMKAQRLKKIEADRLMSRMSGKKLKKLEKEGLSTEEILGIQLEIENDQLMEWREKMAAVKESEAKKKIK